MLMRGNFYYYPYVAIILVRAPCVLSSAVSHSYISISLYLYLYVIWLSKLLTNEFQFFGYICQEILRI